MLFLGGLVLDDSMKPHVHLGVNGSKPYTQAPPKWMNSCVKSDCVPAVLHHPNAHSIIIGNQERQAKQLMLPHAEVFK